MRIHDSTSYDADAVEDLDALRSHQEIRIHRDIHRRVPNQLDTGTEGSPDYPIFHRIQEAV